MAERQRPLRAGPWDDPQANIWWARFIAACEKFEKDHEKEDQDG